MGDAGFISSTVVRDKRLDCPVLGEEVNLPDACNLDIVPYTGNCKGRDEVGRVAGGPRGVDVAACMLMRLDSLQRPGGKVPTGYQQTPRIQRCLGCWAEGAKVGGKSEGERKRKDGMICKRVTLHAYEANAAERREVVRSKASNPCPERP